MKGVIAALVAAEYLATASAARPRGVAPEFGKFYEDATTFACISNPKITFSRSRVNDDYCDCPDGSDEPGTSACAHLSPYSPHTPADTIHNAANVTLALPGFYCKNKGHRPSYVPFTNVNDGICDYELCCDGSEEWDSVGGVKCKDKCDEVGKEWRKQDLQRQTTAAKANKKREELVKEAARLKQQLKDRLQTLKTQIEGAEIKVKDMERELSDVKKKEGGKVVSSTGKGGKLAQLIELGKKRTEELRNSLSQAKIDLDASRSKLATLETAMQAFKEEYNPNFNDEGVKKAVRAWEDYVAQYGMDADRPDNNIDLDRIAQGDEENGLSWADYEDEEGEDTAVIYDFLNYLPPSLRGWVDDKIRDLRQTLIDNGILADVAPSGGESKKVADARSRVESAKNELKGHQDGLKDSQEDVDKDYGPDDVFRALKGVCVERDSGEYTYVHCFLDSTTQKAKKGGGSTNMGRFTELTRITVDDELPTNGKGLGSGERIALKYENGQHCWNGPNRSTTVVLACSEENEIWKVVEEEKCVYRMEMGTPAVCEALKQGQDKGKDEL